MCRGKYMWKSISSQQNFVAGTSRKNQTRLINATSHPHLPPSLPSPLPSWERELNCFDFCLAFSEVLDYRPIRRDVLCVGLQEIRVTNELTNQQRFSMVYTLLDHRNKIKMFKAQGEPRAVIVHEIVAKLFFLIPLIVSLPWRQFPANSLGK